MIKVAPLNKNNFLRWYENTTPTLANSTYTVGTHNGYFYKWKTFADQLPILVGDNLVLYTNFDSDVYFSGRTIGIVEETSCGSYSIISDPLKYDLTTSNWGLNNLKIELSIPATNTENLTNFRLAILGDSVEVGFETSDKFTGTTGTIYGIKKLSTGNYIIYGNTITLDGVTRNIHIVNIAGERVTAGYTFSSFDGTVRNFVEQPDGKLIFVGDFSNYGVNSSPKVARLNSNGTYDATFNVGTGASENLTLVDVDSVGNVYIGGVFSFTYNGSGTGRRITKLSSSGVIDNTYTSVAGSPLWIKVVASDKLLVSQDGVNGIRRRNADGTADATFVSGLESFASVSRFDVDNSGNIYVVGTNLTGSEKVVKLSSEGVINGSFNSVVTEDLRSVRVESDGIYVSGIDAAYVLNSTTGATLEDINVTGTSFNFLKYGTGYLISSSPSTTINVEGTGSIVLAEVVVATETAIDYVSNYFTVLQATEKNINNTHLLSFYHTSNIYDFEWAGFDSVVDDYYTLRVPSSKVGVEYPSEKEIYKEATTGKPRVTRAINNKQISFEIYFNVEELQDAVSTFTNFRYFGVNGDQYIVEAMETEYNKNFNLFKSLLTLKDVQFDRRVNTCLS